MLNVSKHVLLEEDTCTNIYVTKTNGNLRRVQNRAPFNFYTSTLVKVLDNIEGGGGLGKPYTDWYVVIHDCVGCNCFNWGLRIFIFVTVVRVVPVFCILT